MTWSGHSASVVVKGEINKDVVERFWLQDRDVLLLGMSWAD